MSGGERESSAEWSCGLSGREWNMRGGPSSKATRHCPTCNYITITLCTYDAATAQTSSSHPCRPLAGVIPPLRT